MINQSKFIKLIVVPVALTMLAVSHTVNASDTTFTCIEQPETKQPCPVELPKDTIQKLKIEAGFGWGIFNGSIYNGNDKYIITQLVVNMTPIHDDHHHMEMMGGMHHDMPHETRTRHINMNLKPLTKGAISMALDDDVVHVHDFKWEVLKAFGHKVQ
ncbi:MAG: hypothetical protein H6936_06470 [Burkholderiales bacterium]|nr:hypothetical protein [Nitrosomonas sp.]MCP5274485.1 hypothetical protein [Burkholderiales bacterium]